MPDLIETDGGYARLQHALDKYIDRQIECGNPARRQDVVEFCKYFTNMPVDLELARVGHRLAADDA